MALLTNGAQNLGSYYCLIRRRFKRRRKKRSERKGAAGARLLSGQNKPVAMDVDEEENMRSCSEGVVSYSFWAPQVRAAPTLRKTETWTTCPAKTVWVWLNSSPMEAAWPVESAP